MKKIADIILKLIGWNVLDKVGYISKCVICVAPHTSNYDFLMGELTYMHLGRKASFLMKKSWFFFPLGYLLRAIGGIPVDRSQKTSLTQQLSEEFRKRKNFHIAITPEGTRKLNTEWKKGFYFIAKEADVPILLAAIDYKTKTVELRELFHPSGDVEADLAIIKSKYEDVGARHPEKFVI
ncbi:MAG: 1-acyl-sn-glycerol-3-phosphate acyltransferase [Dysgonamonadaceae bacterium]